MDKNLKTVYKLYGLNTAISLLRPGAKWESDGSKFTIWDDPRPMPEWSEVKDTMKKIKEFEESINTVYTEKQLDEINKTLKTMVIK